MAAVGKPPHEATPTAAAVDLSQAVGNCTARMETMVFSQEALGKGQTDNRVGPEAEPGADRGGEM